MWLADIFGRHFKPPPRTLKLPWYYYSYKLGWTTWSQPVMWFFSQWTTIMLLFYKVFVHHIPFDMRIHGEKVAHQLSWKKIKICAHHVTCKNKVAHRIFWVNITWHTTHKVARHMALITNKHLAILQSNHNARGGYNDPFLQFWTLVLLWTKGLWT